MGVTGVASWLNLGVVVVSIYKKGHRDLPDSGNTKVKVDPFYAAHGDCVRSNSAEKAESALRFNKGTELNRSSKFIVVRDYGNGIVEAGLSSVPSPNQDQVDRRRKQRDQDDPSPVSASAPDLERSMRRSKATVRRKCMAGGLDHLLTLTYRENVTDLESAFADLTRFIRLVRMTNSNWKYVAVAEYQKRGAVHFHLAVRGFQQVQLLRHIWLRVVGEGNIDVQSPKHTLRSAWALPKLAGYITKYITKAACTVFGRQRYRVAEGIEIPRKKTIVSFPVGVDQLQEVFDSLGADINYRHESEMGWAWACSW